MSSTRVFDAIKEQRRLIQYWESDIGRGYALGLAEVSIYRNDVETCPQMFLDTINFDNWQDVDGTKLATTLAHRMRTARCFWTHENMVALTQAASFTRPNNPITTEDLPFTSGFALFHKPAHFDMRLNKEDAAEALVNKELVSRGVSPGSEYLVNIAGFSWHQASSGGKPGVDVLIYSAKDDRQDTLMTGLKRKHKYSPWKNTPPLLMVASFFIPYGEHHLDDVFAHFVCTWWHLIGQPLAAVETQKAPRPLHNMITKLRIDQTVSVVQLRQRPPRKRTDQEGEGRIVDWSHRWIVDGHWRNQWYPSLGIHQSRYIDAYEKGPEDKPLVIREKVYAWNR